MKYLIIVDMQNDFISGSLANEAAQRIVKPLANYIKEFQGTMIFTRDTHSEDYLDTYEGKNLPVKHCIMDTDGWQINDELLDAVISKEKHAYVFDKPTFGYASRLANFIKQFDQYPTSIEFTGTCTDICVISNVLGLKEFFPEIDIIVHSNLCAGLSEEKHNAALEVMKSCQVKVL